MVIDIIFIVIIIIAIIKGYNNGLIIAVFSVAALFIGLAAAIKLSVVVANRLKDTVHVAAKWLPILSFALVFIVVVLLVRLGAKALQKTASLVFLGWVNRLGGILLYALLYTIIFSVCLFYAGKADLISSGAVASSKTYNIIAPWGPKSIDAIGAVIPFFKNMFHQLEDFFAGLSAKMQAGY